MTKKVVKDVFCVECIFSLIAIVGFQFWSLDQLVTVIVLSCFILGFTGLGIAVVSNQVEKKQRAFLDGAVLLIEFMIIVAVAMILGL